MIRIKSYNLLYEYPAYYWGILNGKNRNTCERIDKTD